MRRLLSALATLPLALWACDGGARSGLPAEPSEERLSSVSARQRGRELFLAHCALCHGTRADGAGVRRNLSSRPQDFTDPAWRARVRPAEVFAIIREGRRGTAMAGSKTLDEPQIWDLVAYVLSVSGSDG